MKKLWPKNIDAFKVKGSPFLIYFSPQLKKFKLKALYSLNIAFYGFTSEETQHMKDVTIENGGTPVDDLNDAHCTHIVINDQEVKHMPRLSNGGGLDIIDGISSTSNATSGGSVQPTTPTSKNQAGQAFVDINMSPFSHTRAFIVRAEWFWASIQICCRASECLYEFTKVRFPWC